MKYALTLGLLFLAGFARTTPAFADRPNPAWEKGRLQAGQALYRSNCVVCHDVDEAKTKKFGPSFHQLFRREKMPMSAMKPNREYIKMRTRFGGAFMPAFQKTLSAAQIELIVDYLQAQ